MTFPTDRDVTDDINAWLEACANTPTKTAQLEPKSYQTDRNIVVPEGVHLDVTGCTFRRLTDSRGLPRLTGEKQSYVRTNAHIKLKKGATLTGGTAQGSATPTYSPDTEAQHGVLCLGDNLVTDFTGNNVFGDFVAATGPNVYVKNLKGDGAGRQGISANNGSNIKFDVFDIKNIARSAIDLEPMARINGSIDGFEATNGIIGAHKNATLASGGSGDCVNVTLDNVKVVGRHISVGVESSGKRANFNIIGCSGESSLNRPAFTFKRTDGILVKNCKQAFHGKRNAPFEAVRAIDCTDVRQEDNDFVYNWR